MFLSERSEIWRRTENFSAGVVKAAIFAAADDINAKFDTMPMTWGQIWQSMENTAIMGVSTCFEQVERVGEQPAVPDNYNECHSGNGRYSGHCFEYL